MFSLILLNINQSRAQDGFNFIAQGNKEMNEGNYRKAEQYYLTALAKEPQNWNLYTLIGFSLHKQNYFNKSDSFYMITIQNDSLSSKAYWYKGMNLVKMKKDSLAILSYKKFIDIEKKRNGSLIEAYKQVGKSYERILRKTGLYSNEVDDMIFHLEQIEITDPSYPEVPVIKNFVELLKTQRPKQQVGKWILMQ